MLNKGRPRPPLAAPLVTLLLTALVFAQSGRTPPPPPPETRPTPSQREASPAPLPTPEDAAADLERVMLVQACGFENFVRELNSHGAAGYRLEKSVGYGGRGPGQTFAAVLRLDPGHAYEYDWLSSPNRDLLDLRLNTLAKQGFNFAETYAVSSCGDDNASEDPDDPLTRSLSVFKFLKGNVYLFERRDKGAEGRTREYKFFTGKVGWGKNPKEALQAALDAAPQGSRPLKVLFSKTGMLDFRISLLVERDLTEAAPAKVEHRVVKEVSGFEKEVNKLAAEGFRLVTAARSGSVNFAVLARRAADATAYTFLDDEKHAKEFDRTVAAGNAYHGLMAGAMGCDDSEVANQKLVFARGGERREYRVLTLAGAKGCALAADGLAEFRRLAAENYRVRDIFYARGLSLVMER